MIYNTVLVKYKNSWQLRSYQFPIKSDKDNKLDNYDVFENKGDFESTEKEIDSAFAVSDSDYHFEGHSAYVSVNRSKNKIFYYARSNDWTNGYFVTLTLDPEQINSFDYKEAVDCVRKFLDYLRKYDSNIYALIVPERHKSGAFHFHGLIHGDIKDILKYSGHTVNGSFIYNFIRGWKYGFSNVTKVQNTLAVEKYICKYTTKELLNDTLYQHRYFTLNLAEAEMVKLNLYEHDELYKELLVNGLVHYCNTDGCYNRCTYSEIKNDEKVLQIIRKYINITNEINS